MGSITEAGAMYTAWALREVPAWMLEGAPGGAACLVMRETGDPEDPAVIGWIEACGACPGGLAGEFLRLVSAAQGRVSLEGDAALVIYPRGAVSVAIPRDGVSDDAFRRECLGHHVITHIDLTSRLAMWSGADAEHTEQVNVAATALAHSFGFIFRRLHGPVMLCRTGGGDGAGDLTTGQLIQLLTRPFTAPARPGAGLALAGSQVPHAR